MTLRIPQEYIDYVNAHGLFEGETSDDTEPGYIELWAPDAIQAENEGIEIKHSLPALLLSQEMVVVKSSHSMLLVRCI